MYADCVRPLFAAAVKGLKDTTHSLVVDIFVHLMNMGVTWTASVTRKGNLENTENKLLETQSLQVSCENELPLRFNLCLRILSFVLSKIFKNPIKSDILQKCNCNFCQPANQLNGLMLAMAL